LGLPIEAKKNQNWAIYDPETGVGMNLNANNMKVGKIIYDERGAGGGQYIITDILGDGKFKAVPKNIYDKVKNGNIVTENGKRYLLDPSAEPHNRKIPVDMMLKSKLKPSTSLPRQQPSKVSVSRQKSRQGFVGKHRR
jgi:hypothetical protein